MTIHLVTTILLGVDSLVIAVWGGVLGVRALPRRQNKSPHVWAFAVLGTVGFVLVVLVGLHADQAETEASKTAAKMSFDLADEKATLDRTQQALSESLRREQRVEDQNSDLRAVVEAEDSRLQVIGRTLPPKFSKEVAKIHRHFKRDIAENLEIRDSISPPVPAGLQENQEPQEP